MISLKFNALRSERFQRLSKEGLWIVLGQILAMAGSLAGVRMMTELMSPEEYGRLALGMTVATLVGQTVFGPLASGATRFYAPALEREDLRSYFSDIRKLVIWATAIISLVTIVSIPLLILYRKINLMGIFTAAIIFAIFTGLNSILNGIQNAARQRSIVALHQGLESWLRFLVPVGFLMWIARTSTIAMTGSVIAVGIVICSQYLFFRKIIPLHLIGNYTAKNWQKEIIKYAWPMALTGVMSWGFFASQRWALELFTTTSEVGYFSAVFQIGFAPFSLAGGVLMTLMMPVIFNRVGDGGNSKKLAMVSGPIIQFCVAATLLVLVGTAFGVAFHGLVFRLLVAHKYQCVSHYLPYAIFSAGMFQVSLFLSTIILASTKTKLLLPINTIGNLVVICLNMLFTFRFGVGGLFLAMAVGSVVHLGWNSYNVYRVSRNV